MNYLSLHCRASYYPVTMQFSSQVVLSKLLVEDLNTSFAAQHGLSVASVNGCKENLNHWNNYNSGKYLLYLPCLLK